MNRRLYFLAPDVDTARGVVDDMLLARIPEQDMHVVARHDVTLDDLPESTPLEHSDLKQSLTHGIAVGGATGVLAGLVAVTFPPAGVALGGGLLAATTLAGASFGAWASSMIGVSVPNREIEEFEVAIKRGELLMMIDVPVERVEEIEKRLRRKLPEVTFGGVDSHVPVFP